jgi:hypothetical protein
MTAAFGQIKRIARSDDLNSKYTTFLAVDVEPWSRRNLQDPATKDCGRRKAEAAKRNPTAMVVALKEKGISGCVEIGVRRTPAEATRFPGFNRHFPFTGKV